MNTQEKVDALYHLLTTRGWLEVIEPGIIAYLRHLDDMWMSGKRPTGQESVTDEQIKERIRMLRWMLDWKIRYKVLVDQLGQMTELQRQTEDAGQGGSPY